MSADRAKRIAELNDQLRARIGIPQFGSGVPGRVLCTPGISALAPEDQIKLWFAVNRYDAFDEDNNPYGERDFGCIDLNGAGKVFCKIEYYEDESCEYGSPTPEDPERSYRVLTIMLAEEY